MIILSRQDLARNKSGNICLHTSVVNRHSSRLCRFCVGGVLARCIVQLFDKSGEYVEYDCCWECAGGWLEIGDHTNDLVV